MTIIRIFFVFILTIPFQLYAQIDVLDSYPVGQDFYVGGRKALVKEMVAIVKKEGLLPCANTEENYTVNILVYADSSINYIKDFDTVNINKNKCAYDFSRQVIPYLKKWLPAKENGKFIGAIAKVSIQPFILYYSKEDPKDNKIIDPYYKRGLSDFAEDVEKIMQDFIKRNEDRRTYLTFVVNEEGVMQDFEIEGDYSDTERKRMIDRFSRLKGKWEPGTFNGMPRKVYIKQLISQNFDVQLEIERNNSQIRHFR
ncbi:hypothetical protein [Chryseobacterium shigense]|uniref:TonB protein C-terminal n=1 Tax=Chryseobacterium shigense TaxID=297244 RepID=A0A841N1V8_9FLAO|nr:hypothetical protein [Chryseobacterium shigense]MBB6371126.1 hypothetical protein [Chryseobacterium shigense]